MKWIKKAAFISMSILMFQTYSSFAEGSATIPEQVFTDLSSVIDQIGGGETSPVPSPFPVVEGSAASEELKTKVEYKRDRNTGTLTLNLLGLEFVKIDEKNEKISIPISTEVLAQNNISSPMDFQVDKKDRLITTYRFVQGEVNYFEIDLMNQVKYSISQNSYGIIIQLNKMTPANPRIVIDPGHGGKDPGSTSKITGTQEKTIALKTGVLLRDVLISKGYDVVMSRDGDIYPTLTERSSLANDMDADVFISIHYNSAPNSAITGIETYTYMTEDNKTLANSLHNQLISATGANNRGVKNGNRLVVLNTTKVPATLLELGFLSNAKDAKFVLEEDYQNNLAHAIARGIDQYFGR